MLLSFCKPDRFFHLQGCVCLCLSVYVLLRLHQPPADGTKAAMPFVLWVSIFLLVHTVPSLWWLLSEASARLLHTYIYFWKAWKPKLRQSIHAWAQRGKYFGYLSNIFGFVLSYKCFSWKPIFWLTNDTWWKALVGRPTELGHLCELMLGTLSKQYFKQAKHLYLFVNGQNIKTETLKRVKDCAASRM